MAIECHSCFQWLMPTIDQFRDAWPEVELDLASGFPSPRCRPWPVATWTWW
jgi:LysR family transcriptional regulator for metE and metH